MEKLTVLDDAYARFIFKLAEEKKDEIFYNSSPAHAIIVHQALMKTAKNYVDIFSSSMCTEISNNSTYLFYMKKFLEGDLDRKIHILFTDYSEEFKTKPVSELLAKYPTQVTIKKYNGNLIYEDKPMHFTVADGRAFRFETDIEKQIAFGNFNSSELAQILETRFKEMFTSEDASLIYIDK